MKPLLNISTEFLSSLGVADWGYTEDPVPSSFEKFDNWVERGENGPLNYLSDHRKDLRKNLDSVQEGFQSALVFLFSYSEEKLALENFYKSNQSNKLKVAGYSIAFEGGDYHNILREKMALIGEKLGKEYSFSLDIHPVLERDLAYRSGLGWFGKNSMLIHQKVDLKKIQRLMGHEKIETTFNTYGHLIEKAAESDRPKVGMLDRISG